MREKGRHGERERNREEKKIWERAMMEREENENTGMGRKGK